MDPLRLLVVEDSRDLIQVWRTLFRMSTDYKVKYCLSGAAAKEIMESGFIPDVVLTDYYLGDTNGIDLIDWIKLKIPQVKFIMLTGNHEDEKISKCHQYGCFCLLHKPVKFQMIKRKIDDMRIER